MKLRHHLPFLLLFIALPAFGLTPASITVITREELEGRAFFTVADVLSETGAFDVRALGNHGSPHFLRARGLPPQNVLVAIDGRPLNALYGEAVDLTQFPVSFIDRIEITPGGAPTAMSSQGGGMVINLVSARPKEEGLEADLNTQVGRDGVKNTNGLLTGRNYYGDLSYAGALGEYGGFTFHEGGEMDAHFGKVTRYLPGNGFWAASYFFEESENDLSNGTPVALDLWDKRAEQLPSTPDRLKKEDTNRINISAASPEFFSSRILMDVTHSLRDEEEFPRRGNAATFERETVLSDGSLTFDSRNIDFGFQHQSEKSRFSSNPEKKRNTDSGFFLLDFSGDRYFFKPGVRLDNFSGDDSYWSPRLAAGGALGFLDTFGSASLGARRPTFFELYDQSNANSALTSERVEAYDFGLAFGRDPSRKISATGFYSRVEDAIVNNGSTLQNTGTRETSGVEGRLRFEAGRGTRFFHVRLDGDWVNQKSQVRQTGPFQTAAFVPENIGRGALTHFLPRRIEITNELVFWDDRHTGDGRTGTFLRSVTVWNARVAIRILKSLIYLEGRNLLQKRYPLTEVTYIPDGGGSPQTALAPAPSRALYGGVRIYFRN